MYACVQKPGADFRGGLRAEKAITYFSRPTPRPLVRELTLEERAVSRWFRRQKFIADSSPTLIYWQNGLTSVEIQRKTGSPVPTRRGRLRDPGA
jgi:hypothetical protein